MSTEHELTASDPLQSERAISPSNFSSWNSFKHHMPRLIITLLVDVFIPLLIYFALKDHIAPVYALLIASSPSVFMVIFKGVWERSFDALGFLVSGAFILSAILAVLFNNPIILLLETSWLTGAGAIIFAITLIPFKCGRFQCRPMVYYFYHDLFPVTSAEFGLPDDMFTTNQYTELKDDDRRSVASNRKDVANMYSWLYEHCSSFRVTCYFMTCVWIVAFTAECLVRYTLIIYGLSINSIFIYGQIMFMVVVTTCAILQICSMIVERRYTLAHIAQWKLEQKRNASKS